MLFWSINCVPIWLVDASLNSGIDNVRLWFIFFGHINSEISSLHSKSYVRRGCEWKYIKRWLDERSLVIGYNVAPSAVTGQWRASYHVGYGIGSAECGIIREAGSLFACFRIHPRVSLSLLSPLLSQCLFEWRRRPSRCIVCIIIWSMLILCWIKLVSIPRIYIKLSSFIHYYGITNTVGDVYQTYLHCDIINYQFN